MIYYCNSGQALLAECKAKRVENNYYSTHNILCKKLHLTVFYAP